MTKQKWNKLEVFYGAAALTWVCLFVVLAFRTYFSDSEIWGLTISQSVFHPHDLASVYYKLSFHIVTYFFSHFAPSEVDVYLWARAGWAAIGLTSLWLTARLFSEVHGQPKLKWPLFTFLITASIFLNQGFRIRADLLCLFAHMLFLTHFYKVCQKGPRRRDFAILTAIHILMIASTPKFILFTLCQVALGMAWAQRSPLHHKRLVWLLTFTTMVPVIVGCATVLLLVVTGHNALLLAISTAADFFLKTFNTDFFNPLLFSAVDFYHFFKFYSYSESHAAILTLWIVFYFALLFKKTKDQKSYHSALQIYGALLFFFVIAYNQKLPFFLGAFLTPVLAQAFCFIVSSLSKWRPNWKTHFVFVFILLGSFNGFLNFRLNFLFNNNLLQKEAINTIDQYVTQHPQTRIYDIVGVLPRKNKIFIFVGPSEVSQKTKILDSIREADPDIFLIVYKFKYLDPDFPNLLTEKWVPIGPDIWAKGRFISLKTTPQYFRFTTLLDGKQYWLFPVFPEKYILSNSTFKSIQSETFLLDQNKQVTQNNPTYLAVPQSYLSLVLTDVAPLSLAHQPSTLFRYDTTF